MMMKNSRSSRILSRLLPLFLGLLVLLSGCVRYEVGVNFREQHQGAIVQQIRLGQQITSLSGDEASKYLKSIENRAKTLGGTTKHLSDAEILVTIPFGNGQELVKKFNQLFNPQPENPNQPRKKDNLDLLQLNALMGLTQTNWLFFERNHLNLSVDLRALGVISQQGNIVVSPGDLINLTFVLTTPWGGKNIVSDATIPDVMQDDHRLIWKLQPGQVNTLEAIFWVPSFLGLGTLGIVFLMIVGFILKYRHFPGISPSLRAN